jgi:hypothetical protein
MSRREIKSRTGTSEAQASSLATKTVVRLVANAGAGEYSRHAERKEMAMVWYPNGIRGARCVQVVTY